jgi:hypothetical protein
MKMENGGLVGRHFHLGTPRMLDSLEVQVLFTT